MIKLKSLLAEEDVVKNKKTGNVYVVQSFDPNKHDKPSPAEIEKTKQANNGVLPKSEPQPKQTPQNTTPQKPKQGQKLSGSDFKTSAEKPKDTKDSGMPKLKDLMPGMDTSAKSPSKINSIEKQCGSRSIKANYKVTNSNSTALLQLNTPISIYANTIYLRTIYTQTNIPIDGNEIGQVTVLIPNSIPNNFDLKFVVDDIGTGTGIVTEINETNNKFLMPVELLIPPIFNSLPNLTTKSICEF